MATSATSHGHGALGIATGKGILFLSVTVFGLLLPVLVSFGGSTSLLNWGPGLLFAGMACLLMLGEDRHGLSWGKPHAICTILLFGVLLIRARCSSDESAGANNSALLALAATGYLIGKLADERKSRAMFIGLSVIAMVNLVCTVIQMTKPEWNPLYPQRSGSYPSGFFAHYNYATAFCLGTTGLLASRASRESGWFKSILIGGAACAAIAIPLSLSRGGTLALAFIVAGVSTLSLARAFRKSTSFVSTWLPVGVLIALVVVFANSLVPLINRNRGGGGDGFYGDSCRINFWMAATRISIDHPWIGGGPGNFSWNVFQVIDSLPTEPDMAHNEALQVAVDYGYPALIALAAVIGWPVIRCFWRFVNQTDKTNAAWAAVGLLAMLLQSNFDFVFHTAPGVFIAALILGQISRSLWHAESASNAEKPRNTLHDVRLLKDVIAQVDAYFGEDKEAVSKLIRMLSQSKEEQWKRASYRLTYWSKVQNEDALRKAMNDLRTKCSSDLPNDPANRGVNPSLHVESTGGRTPKILGNSILAGCAVATLLFGGMLTQVLADLWEPVYHPNSLAASNRFEQLLQATEHHSGLGLDRKVLSAARDSIHQFKNLEAREEWATAHRSRILRSLPGWKTDPGSALLLAEIIGWTGNFQSTVGYYDHAIATQGANESLFLAHSFKGQYLYELFVSAGASGQTDQQKYYARQTVICLHDAAAAMAKNNGELAPFFAKMLQECETYNKQGT